MDEDEYRAVYQQINQHRCIFEKALNNRRCDCAQKRRFTLATREGVGCHSETALANCTQFLNTMRQKSRFSLKVITIDGPLPHNKELQVQAGGCLALQKLLFPEAAELVTTRNIDELLTLAIEKYGSIDQLPYTQIMQGIVKYESRKKRNKR